MKCARRVGAISIGLAGLSLIARAGLPEPDVLLFGHVFIDRVVQQKVDDVSVVARVDVPPIGNFPGAEDVSVGVYRLGENAAATGAVSDGDAYVLRIRLESLVDGSSRTSGNALVGDAVRLCVKKGVAAEVCRPQDSVLVAERGQIQSRDIGVRPKFGDWNADDHVNQIDVPDFATCFKGPTQLTSPQCTGVFDADGDYDVDHRDLQLLQSVFGVQP